MLSGDTIPDTSIFVYNLLVCGRIDCRFLLALIVHICNLLEVDIYWGWNRLTHGPLARLRERIGLRLCALKQINSSQPFLLVQLAGHCKFTAELILEFDQSVLILHYCVTLLV